MDTKLKRLISKSYTEDDIWRCAAESGTKTMFEDAWDKIIEGETTFEEVLSKIPFQYIERDDNYSSTKENENHKVLIFDNDENEIRTIRSVLEENGYQVVHSTNGEMLEMTKKEKPMLIITNNSEDKLTNLKEIRNMSQFAFTPIICLADETYKEHEHEGFQLGINDFVYRPLDAKKLLFSINRIIQTF
jgi:PleD family two-component response regulator